MMKHFEDLHEIKNELISKAKSEIEANRSNNLSRLDTDEMSKVADMIKDFSEAEKDCMEAYYCEMLCCSLLCDSDGKDGDSKDRMGYDNWRYNDGRFAPKGSGHYAGFHFPPMMSRFPDPVMINRMGYGGGSGNSGGSNMSGNRGGSGNSGSRGYSYDGYSNAKRYYTQTGDESGKREMNERAREYMSETVMSIKEMMDDADPELKRKIKGDLANLISEMS